MLSQLKAGVEFPVTFEGNWLHLVKAAGELTLKYERDGQQMTLEKNGVIDLGQSIGRVVLVASETGTYQIKTGYGTFTPPTSIEGQRVDISGQTVDVSGQTVDISGQTVDVSGQTVDISGQTVNVSGQTVDISGQTVDVSGQTIKADLMGQTVDISGQTVDVSGQTVDISGQTVDVSGQTIKADLTGQSVAVVRPSTIAAQVIDITTSHSIPANASRSKLIIKAAAGNTEDVIILGAYPLEPSEKLELETGGEITLEASSAQVYVLEGGY